VHGRTVIDWLNEARVAVTARADYLTQLDAAIGDGDHGVNTVRGLDALTEQPPDTPPGRLVTVAGKTFISTVGGASGPLWGAAFRSAGRSLRDA
jgi:dihydroxyacetone kinase-like protein